MKRVGFLYDSIFLKHEMPLGHPESGARLIAINNAVTNSSLYNDLIVIHPRKADKKDMLAVHTVPYYYKILEFTGYFDADTYVSEHSVEAAHFAAGAIIEAVAKCKMGSIDRAFCSVRPPGHHAEADRAMGFCIFNNIAIGARYAQKKGYKRVFIVDFDVHHGNGTQHIFEQDDTVFYFSTHQYPHYPGTGSESEKGSGKGLGFTYNSPMHHGAGDNEYMEVFREILPALISTFSPDILLVSAGYDLHVKDPLAGMRVSSEGVRNIVRSIIRSGKDIPLIFCLEGGYHLNALAESSLITIEELLHYA